jgi:hypothetical protein
VPPVNKPGYGFARVPAAGDCLERERLVERVPGAVLGTRCPYRSTVVVMDSWPSHRETSEMVRLGQGRHWLLEGNDYHTPGEGMSA